MTLPPILATLIERLAWALIARLLRRFNRRKRKR